MDNTTGISPELRRKYILVKVHEKELSIERHDIKIFEHQQELDVLNKSRAGLVESRDELQRELDAVE